MELSLKNLKRIAHNNVNKKVETLDDLQEYLIRWWSLKYNLPSNHPLLLNKTLEELIIDFFEDDFKENPQKMKEFELKEKGQYVDDEEWFKKQMEDEYTKENAVSEDDKNQDIEEDFRFLGK